MPWVTKSSDEEYKPYSAGSREYTKWEKFANWWDYHKLTVLVVVGIAVVLFMMVRDMVGKIDPDYQVGWVGRYDLPVDTVSALEEQLAKFGVDLNGDGRVVVAVNQYTVDFDEENENTDAYNQMAGVTKLSADLSSGKVYVLLIEDPEGFELDTGALQYLDGTLPPDGAADWQNMCYRWTDCPVLAGLDLGDYHGYTLLDDQTGSNQDVLADVYVARRGVWTEKDAARFEGCGDFWRALTAGAAKE